MRPTELQIIRILANLKGAAQSNPGWSKDQLMQSTTMACNCTPEDVNYAMNHSPKMSEYEALDFMFSSDGMMDLCDTVMGD